jgi:hypothetical protein
MRATPERRPQIAARAKETAADSAGTTPAKQRQHNAVRPIGVNAADVLFAVKRT